MLRKYKFTPGSGCIFVKVQVMTSSSMSSPEYFMLDEMPREELKAMMDEYSDEEANACGFGFRGISWSVVDVDELPEEFIESLKKEAQADLEFANMKNAWFENLQLK